MAKDTGEAPKPKKEKKEKFASLAEAGLEAFTVQEIDRADLKNATYNPRVITDKERAKLKAALKRHGLVAPITWNKRTGHIVGGHQRISIMDSLMGAGTYKLSVATIDVDESREKELNILLNNQQAMGSWDLALLKDVLTDEAVSLDGAGLDITDMIYMFGDTSLDNRQEDLSELASKLSELSGQYTAIQKRNKAKESGEFYVVFVFPDRACVAALIEKLGLPENRYQSGKFLMRALGIPDPD